MASSEAEICNIALARIGQKVRITALDDESNAARECNNLFSHIRDVALCEYPWPFATKVADLAILVEEHIHWEYVYQRPSDCLLARFIAVDGMREPSNDERVAFDEGLNAAGTARTILCDLDDASLVYTRAITNVTLFDAHFTDSLAWLLASELAMPMAVKRDIMQDCKKMFVYTAERAIAKSMNSKQGDVQPDSEFIRIRG